MLENNKGLLISGRSLSLQTIIWYFPSSSVEPVDSRNYDDLYLGEREKRNGKMEREETKIQSEI